MEFDLMDYAAILVAGAVIYIIYGIVNLRKSKERCPRIPFRCPSSG